MTVLDLLGLQCQILTECLAEGNPRLHLNPYTNLHQNANVLIIILIKAAGADGIDTFRENSKGLL